VPMHRPLGAAIIVTLAVGALGGCSSSGGTAKRTPTASSTTTASPTPTSSSKPTTSTSPSANTNPDLGPWPESLSWTGAASGILTVAYGTCDLYPGSPTDAIDLRTADFSIAVTIPRHAPGVVAVQTLPPNDGTVSLYLGTAPFGLYQATSGSVTYAQDGDSGSMDVWLATQVGNSMTPPSVHMTGQWTCT
jgi:hypothetical protein